MGLFETDVVPDANSIANSISRSGDNPERSLENTSSNSLTTGMSRTSGLLSWYPPRMLNTLCYLSSIIASLEQYSKISGSDADP